MSTQAEGETWRYEVRGSSLYDNREQSNLNLFEAGEILNAHEALLLKEGVWAAKAGLAEAKADAAAQRLQLAVELLRRLEQWDHMQSAADGPYWLREIAAVLGEEKPYDRLFREAEVNDGK